jgi:hypothetical protein
MAMPGEIASRWNTWATGLPSQQYDVRLQVSRACHCRASSPLAFESSGISLDIVRYLKAVLAWDRHQSLPGPSALAMESAMSRP